MGAAMTGGGGRQLSDHLGDRRGGKRAISGRIGDFGGAGDPLHGAPPLDPWRLDEVLEPPPTGKLWGLPTIAAALGVSVATARRWARKPGVPIYQPDGAGAHFAFLSELRAWLRGRRAGQ